MNSTSQVAARPSVGPDGILEEMRSHTDQAAIETVRSAFDELWRHIAETPSGLATVANLIEKQWPWRLTVLPLGQLDAMNRGFELQAAYGRTAAQGWRFYLALAVLYLEEPDAFRRKALIALFPPPGKITVVGLTREGGEKLRESIESAMADPAILGSVLGWIARCDDPGLQYHLMQGIAWGALALTDGEASAVVEILREDTEGRFGSDTWTSTLFALVRRGFQPARDLLEEIMVEWEPPAEGENAPYAQVVSRRRQAAVMSLGAELVRTDGSPDSVALFQRALARSREFESPRYQNSLLVPIYAMAGRGRPYVDDAQDRRLVQVVVESWGLMRTDVAHHGLRILSLIDHEGIPRAALETLSRDDLSGQQRREILRSIAIVRDRLGRTPAPSVDEAWREAAAQFVQIPGFTPDDRLLAYAMIAAVEDRRRAWEGPEAARQGLGELARRMQEDPHGPTAVLGRHVAAVVAAGNTREARRIICVAAGVRGERTDPFERDP